MKKEFKGTIGNWTYSTVMNFSDSLVSFIRCGEKQIAQTRGCITGEEEEVEANAKLIAAAPKLLEALQDLTRFCKENKVGAELELAESIIEKILNQSNKEENKIENLKTISGRTIKIVTNYSKRTFTIITESGKYRTAFMPKEEFDFCQMNTGNDWQQFLNSDISYYKIN